MKLKFDSTQPFQLQAVNSFVDLFDGQPLNQGDYTVEINASNQIRAKLAFFNQNWVLVIIYLLMKILLLKNLHNIQERNDLDATPEQEFKKNGLTFQ
jgi:type III restriction enzyme